jgi:hypothetical protein
MPGKERGSQMRHWLDLVRLILGTVVPPAVLISTFFTEIMSDNFILIILGAAALGGILLSTWSAAMLVPLSMLIGLGVFLLGWGPLVDIGVVPTANGGAFPMEFLIVPMEFLIVIIVLIVGPFAFAGAVLGVAIARVAAMLCDEVGHRYGMRKNEPA